MSEPRSDYLPLRVYVASKTKWAPMWHQARDRWAPDAVIVSTWIDEAGEGESPSLSDLWTRCVAEASSADLVIAYHRPGDAWKGAFVEIGAALACGIRVYVDGEPPGSWTHHPLVHRARDVDHALHVHRLMTPRGAR